MAPAFHELRQQIVTNKSAWLHLVWNGNLIIDTTMKKVANINTGKTEK
jgi:hypothetical protein